MHALRHTSRVLIAIVAVMLATTGCGNWQPPSLTGPSPTGGSSNGATISGTVQGYTSASTATADTTGATLTVTVEGTTLTVAVDSTGRFVLTGVPSGMIQLKFSGPGIDATLVIEEVENRETINLVVTVSGSTVTVEFQQSLSSSGKVELEGLISEVEPGDVDRTLTVKGQNVRVPEGTEIKQGSTTREFDDLKVGQRVHVRGTMEGNTVVATLVIMQGDADDDDSDKGQNVNVKGTASGLLQGCPNVEFKLAGWTVVTDSSTDWKKGGCGLLANGSSLHVKGRVQSTGKVRAEWVMFQ
jgi:hypothetical protein